MADWTGVAGKRVVITGATNGIGLEAATALGAKGAKLTLVARGQSKAKVAVDRIEAAGGRGVEVILGDLSRQSDVRRVAAELLERCPRIDVLLNNAGAIFATRQLTEDGVEMTWAVNHLAPFLLTSLLLDRLTASAPARIVTTASDAHRGAKGIPFDDMGSVGSYRARGFARYGETKLANILFTQELGRRLQGSGVTAYCFHPGFVATGFNRNNGALMNLGMTLARPFARTPEKGAETLVWLCENPDVSADNGGYFQDCRRIAATTAGQDADAARRLWEVSESQVGAQPRNWNA